MVFAAALALGSFGSSLGKGDVLMEIQVTGRLSLSTAPLLVATEDPHRRHLGVSGDCSLSAGSIVRRSSAKVLGSLRVG
jgi:hypothetical protein